MAWAHTWCKGRDWGEARGNLHVETDTMFPHLCHIRLKKNDSHWEYSSSPLASYSDLLFITLRRENTFFMVIAMIYPTCVVSCRYLNCLAKGQSAFSQARSTRWAISICVLTTVAAEECQGSLKAIYHLKEQTVPQTQPPFTVHGRNGHEKICQTIGTKSRSETKTLKNHQAALILSLTTRGALAAMCLARFKTEGI